MFRRLFKQLMSHPFVPVVKLEGVIQSGRGGFSDRSINLAGTSRLLERAFSFPNTSAVALVINSPGGSAAQSHLIARRVLQLNQKKKLPVYAFVEDAAASGGYILALAADEIYCDVFSIVGSVGVIAASFGFEDAISKLGIQRRLTTAGKRKSLLDPFLKETPEDKERLKRLLDGMHVEFKSFVKERRGKKLTQPDEVLFEGDFWLAKQGMEYGLIDGIGDIRSVLRNKFGDNVYMQVMSSPRSFLLPFEGGVSSAVADLKSEIKASNQWTRIGL